MWIFNDGHYINLDHVVQIDIQRDEQGKFTGVYLRYDNSCDGLSGWPITGDAAKQFIDIFEPGLTKRNLIFQ